MASRFDLTLNIDIPGLEPVRLGLSRMLANVKDWRPFWKDFGIAFRQMAEDNFKTEGASTGSADPWFGITDDGSWEALSPRYLKWKKQHAPGKSALRLTDRMYRAATGRSGESVYKATPTALEIGLKTPYAPHHQFGTERMPQRPIFRADNTFVAKVGKLLHRFMRDMIAKNKAGGK